jgi:uncharacterized protein YyaL (SSP411 family)
LRTSPAALAEMLLAVDFLLDAPKQILLVAPQGKKEMTASLLSVFRRRFVPNRVLSVVTEGEDQEKNARIVPLLEGKEALDRQATAYVCEGRVCRLPTHDPAEFERQLCAVNMLRVASGKVRETGED